MKNKKNKSKYDTLDSIIHYNFLNMNKQLARRDAILLDSGFYDTESWGGLRKCWKGFGISKVEGDTKKMEYYAKGIRKFQRELKISVSEFPRFALLSRKMPEELDSENYWPDSNTNSCAQTQRELEHYRLQELAEDPIDLNLNQIQQLQTYTSGMDRSWIY
jgi:hypothetical protein